MEITIINYKLCISQSELFNKILIKFNMIDCETLKEVNFQDEDEKIKSNIP